MIFFLFLITIVYCYYTIHTYYFSAYYYYYLYECLFALLKHKYLVLNSRCLAKDIALSVSGMLILKTFYDIVLLSSISQNVCLYPLFNASNVIGQILDTLYIIAPKLLYGQKVCDLADLLTPLAIHTLLYSRK